MLHNNACLALQRRHPRPTLPMNNNNDKALYFSDIYINMIAAEKPTIYLIRSQSIGQAAEIGKIFSESQVAVDVKCCISSLYREIRILKQRTSTQKQFVKFVSYKKIKFTLARTSLTTQDVAFSNFSTTSFGHHGRRRPCVTQIKAAHHHNQILLLSSKNLFFFLLFKLGHRNGDPANTKKQ